MIGQIMHSPKKFQRSNMLDGRRESAPRYCTYSQTGNGEYLFTNLRENMGKNVCLGVWLLAGQFSIFSYSCFISWPFVNNNWHAYMM